MHIFDIKVLNLNPTVYLSSSVISTWPMRTGYASRYSKRYFGGVSILSKPLVRGASSAFTSSVRIGIIPVPVQLIVEPLSDDSVVLVYDADNEEESVTITYLQNGVYLLSYKDQQIRIVAPTGAVAIKVSPTADELFVAVNNTSIRLDKVATGSISLEIAPDGGIAYDKVIGDAEINVEEIVASDIKIVNGQGGIFMPMFRDQWYESSLVTAEQMDSAEDYRVTSRGLTLANTSVVFYSNLDNIEKSIDAENWEPVNAVEFHGQDQVIYRSKDPDFALEYFDTEMKDIIIPGATTAITGNLYKVGNNIGSLFSHDGYRLIDGSFRIESDNLRTVSILGKIPDSIVDQLSPQIDFNGTKAPGKMHLYTFEVDKEFEIAAGEMTIAGVGINMNHEDLMNVLAKRVEISYADEIHDIEIGQSKNGDNEYSILDLQWNV